MLMQAMGSLWEGSRIPNVMHHMASDLTELGKALG